MDYAAPCKRIIDTAQCSSKRDNSCVFLVKLAFMRWMCTMLNVIYICLLDCEIYPKSPTAHYTACHLADAFT